MTEPGRRPLLRAATLCSILASASYPGLARADEPRAPRVGVALSGCDPSLAGEVQRIAGVELRAVMVDPADAQVVATRALVTCHDAVADLWVSDPVTSKLVGRTVLLGVTSPPARARLLALAVAELVTASWEEVESNAAPAVAAARLATPEARAAVRAVLRTRPSAPPAAPPPEGVAIDALAEARAFTGGAIVFGGAVRSTVRLGSPLTLRLDAGSDFGDASRARGQVSILSEQIAVALGWRFDGTLVWAGARAGFARLEGQAIENAIGHVESGAWAGPEGGVDWTLWPSAVVHGTLGVAIGAALQGVRGDVQGEASVALLGAWAALTLGVGIARP